MLEFSSSFVQNEGKCHKNNNQTVSFEYDVFPNLQTLGLI